VLLPGFMGEAETSFLYILALADHLRVVSVSYPPLIAQVDMLGESLCALLDHLGIAQAALLGGSSSGCLAQAFVRRHPARFERLILTHTGLPSLTRARTARRYLRLLRCLPFGLLRQVLPLSVAAYFPRQTPVHAFWRAHFQAVLCRLTLDGLRNRFALMDDFHSHAHFQAGDLAAWPGKVLLMEMSRDHLTTPAEQAAMRALYPGASLRIFSNAAHYDAVEDPEEQIQAILEAYA
jgi:pimeloyl-ACP methyl ester carboxylesterase